MVTERSQAEIILKKGREKSIRNRHPWIFSGAVQGILGSPESGETVIVRTTDGAIAGRGAFSPRSQIRVRFWTFLPHEDVSEAFFRTRLERAVAARSGPHPAAGRSGRLVYAESDGLPGLIVDRYEDYLVCQFLSAGAEHWKKTISSLLLDLVPVKGIYERSDGAARKKEGLPQVSGTLAGELPPDLIEIQENSYRFWVDVKRGQKTGCYLDQRDNRRQVADWLKHAEVLDCFAYTGAFTLAALKAGASRVTAVDSSANALALAHRNIVLNDLDASAVSLVEGDAFSVLRRYRETGRRFDAVILDPPKFALSAVDVQKALRAYKDINLAALRLLRPGGILVTFSCSHHVGDELFQKAVAYAALDAGRDVQIGRRLHQPPDHPVSLNFPESAYLKGLICRVW